MNAMQLAIRDIKKELESLDKVFIAYSPKITHEVRSLVVEQIKKQKKLKRKRNDGH